MTAYILVIISKCVFSKYSRTDPKLFSTVKVTAIAKSLCSSTSVLLIHSIMPTFSDSDAVLFHVFAVCTTELRTT